MLGKILAKASDKQTLLLPKIQPIGDIDAEDFLSDDASLQVHQAISRTGQLLMMLDLLKDWALQNPHLSIAGEISTSALKSLNLATSLLELFDHMEVEETNLENLAEAYQADLSEHRTSILTVLELLKIKLPQKLKDEKLIGPSARRSLLIRLEAERIASAKLKGPIIAAGSTGTIPATRHLLKTIACHPQGAVVLPGVDQYMADDQWGMIGPDHPQFTLRTLIASLGVERHEIITLGQTDVSRTILSSEIMRPSASTDTWHTVLPSLKGQLETALHGLNLVSARDRHLEARSIALIMRKALETPHKTAALVTPDRDLALRVKSELLRWDINIDDSAGTPLTNHGLASLAALSLRSLSNGLKSADILAVLAHADCTLGFTRDELLRQLRHFEIVVLRGFANDIGPEGWQLAFARAKQAKQSKARLHSLAMSLTDEDWNLLAEFVEKLTEIFTRFGAQTESGNLHFISGFKALLMQLAPDADWSKPANQIFKNVLEQLEKEAHRLATSTLQDWLEIVLHILEQQTLPSSDVTHPRLSIYGVLEARLLHADIMIVGGMNEGVWPVQPDSGPWLNRPMRSIFHMQQPERDIGAAAHDFVQALGFKTVYITWCQRLQKSPQIPSRWILRLQTVLAAAGLSATLQDGQFWLELAHSLDAGAVMMPVGKPKPCPPIATRPRQFSVTEVEKLIRDPYAIYAKKILKLEPLPVLSREPDAALRGTLFHNALKIWNERMPEKSFDANLAGLIEAGEEAFANLHDDPEIKIFWWPRFARIAQWLAKQDIELRTTVQNVFAEVQGSLTFSVGAISHILTARADRIDIFRNKSARILDYKSGKPPTAKEVISGISPQLPLEAAILSKNGFKTIGPALVEEFLYVQITGSNPAGDLKYIDPGLNLTIDELAQKHLSGFQQLLSRYQNKSQAYLPRVAIQKDRDFSDYDHLSRHLEWILAGEK